MYNRTLRCIALSLLFAAVGSTVHANTYTVTLTNGTVFETRYNPVTAEWDDNVVMISTDRGNWIGIFADEIADVTSKVESTGFGYQVDSTTLYVGWSPNDIDEEGEDGEKALNLEEMFPEAEASYSVQQFVNVPTLGTGVGGQPVTDN